MLKGVDLNVNEGDMLAVVGESGVGKSSLINRLLRDDRQRVASVSDKSGEGRHTTTASVLHHLPDAGELIDSPGVRSFRLGKLTRQELEQGFREFVPFLGQCRFHNCVHLAEPGCAIRAAVERGEIAEARLASYHHMVGETRCD